jgi:small-conductance mechanosensitive channel
MKALEEMSIQELMELNTRVGDRIRYIIQMEAQEKMTRFYFGDVVIFEATDGRKIRGTVERFNQKSVSIKDESGHRWRVSPQLLKKVPTAVLSTPYKHLES